METSTYAPAPQKFEAGVPVAAQAVGLAAACDYLTALGLDRVHAHEQVLTQRLLAGLAQLAERSGGRVIEVARLEEVPDAFRAILDELRSQYVLGWYPTGLEHDGAWRDLRVDVTRRGVDARSRSGYYDD